MGQNSTIYGHFSNNGIGQNSPIYGLFLIEQIKMNVFTGFVNAFNSKNTPLAGKKKIQKNQLGCITSQRYIIWS